MSQSERHLAIVTGASTGIGKELATLAAKHRYDLVVAANEDAIETAAKEFRALGAEVDAVNADLSTTEGVDQLIAAVRGRPVMVLMANAGTGLKDAFLDQEWEAARHVVDTNVIGTIYLLHRVGNMMRSQCEGRILITGSIAGFIPGAYHAVYNASKAFMDNFSFALRAELKDSGVTVTCLMPGATETDFFERAELEDTKLGQSPKQSAAEVAKTGFDAMLRGDGDVVSGWLNKLQAAIAQITPSSVLASMHAGMAKPGSGRS